MSDTESNDPPGPSALELLRSVTTDAGRTANAVTLLRAACLVALVVGLVAVAAAVAVAVVTHALGAGPAVGGVVALGGGASWAGRRARRP
jgi:hypothetical protein